MAEIYERCQKVMIYLHRAPRNVKHSHQSIALNTGIALASVSKTIYQDYPECFTKDLIFGGTTLSGIFPGGIEFDLEPPKEATNRVVPKFKGEFIDSAAIALRKYLTEEGYIAVVHYPLNRPRDAEYWRIYNIGKFVQILMQIKASPNPRKKIGELIEKPDDSKFIQALLKEIK
jgi:hypothetical protein